MFVEAARRVEVIASRLNVNTSTVYNWLSRMHCNGLGARYDKAKPGRPRKIDSKLYNKSIAEAIDKQPEGCGIKSNVWTGRLILI